MADPGEKTRKVTKELLDISKNAVLVGGLTHFAQKGGSTLLSWIAAILYFVLVMHIQSYIQGTAFGRFLRDRVGLWSRAASFVGWALALLVTFALVMVTDQAIERIAFAQTK